MNWGGNNHAEASTIIRYNIGVNIGGKNQGYEALFLFRTNSNTYIYNNVFYDDSGLDPFRLEGSGQDTAAFVNNVFHNTASPIIDLNHWKSGQSATATAIYFDHNAYSPAATPIANSYPASIGKTFEDKNAVRATLYQDKGTPPGGGSSAGKNTVGYTGIITGTPRRDIRELAKYFMIDESSPLYKAGREVTKEEVNDFLWGRPAAEGKPQGKYPPHDSMRFAKPDLFDVNAYEDFFGLPVPRGTAKPSIGIHEAP